jgi:ferritin heavy chain
MAGNDIRQNFHEESENGINEQINMELYASYVYLSMVNMT